MKISFKENLDLPIKSWLPSLEASTAVGKLKYDYLSNNLELELLEELPGSTTTDFGSFGFVNTRGFSPEILLGINERRTPITFLNCKETAGRSFPRAVHRFLLTPQFVFLGKHFKNKRDINFSKIECKFLYLDSWLHPLIGIESKRDENSIQISYPLESEIIKCNLLNGDSVSVISKPKYSTNKSIMIGQNFYVSWHFHEPANWETCLHNIWRMQQFVTLGTQLPSFPEEVTGWTEDDFQVSVLYRTNENKDISKDLKLQYPSFDLSSSIETGKANLYLKNWFDKEKELGQVYSLFCGPTFNNSMYLDDMFLSSMRAIDCYYQKSSFKNFERQEKKIYLSDKIEFCINLFSNFLNQIPNDLKHHFTRSSLKGLKGMPIAHYRNYLIHYNDNEKTADIEPLGTLKLYQILKSLIAMCLMLEIGLPQNHCNQFIQETIQRYNILFDE